jgi:DNA-binding NtrC family response regulator
VWPALRIFLVVLTHTTVSPNRVFRAIRNCGNVVGLRSIVGGVVTKQNLNGQLGQIVDELVRRGVPLDQARREFEKQFIVATLRTNEGNLSRSARSLGVHRNTLRNKVSDLGIAPRDIGASSARRRRLIRH